MKSANESKSIWKIIKPICAIYIIFTYLLGVSAARYLGGKIDIMNVLIGLVLCLLIHEMRNFLGAYFNHPESYHSTLNLNDPERAELLNIRRPVLLQYLLLILTAGATLTTILMVRGVSGTSTVLLLGIALLINFFSASPPLRLSSKGYEEVFEAIYVTNLVPALAFSLQGIPLSLLIIEITLPLTFIYLAMKIALTFKTFGFDLTHGRDSLVTRAGWQNAMVMHNLFIILAFVLVSVFFLLGIPWSLTWPLLLGLPVGAVQIFQLQSIANGTKPKWLLLHWLAVGLFLLLTYLEIISLWM